MLIDEKIDICITTNGINLRKFAEFDNVEKIESLHISRHHYNDEINRKIFQNDEIASSEDIKHLQSLLKDKLIIQFYLFKIILFIGGQMNHNIFNSFSLAGNIAKINEVKEQSNGTKFMYFTLCQNNKYKNKEDEIIDQANFYDIKVYEGNFKDFQNLEVGKYINVFGKIKVYKDNENKTILSLVGNAYRSLSKEKNPEIYDYDWLNEGDDRGMKV